MAAIPKSRIREGLPHPRGATWDGKGINFALFSAHATKVELCLFDPRARRRSSASSCPNTPTRSGTAICPTSARDGLRLPRPRPLRAGRRATASIPNKLLLDPYARAHVGELKWDPAVFGYPMAIGRRPHLRRARQRALHAEVRGRRPELRLAGRARPPARALGPHRSSTRRMCAASPSCIPTVPEAAARHLSPASAPRRSIDYIKSLGVTSVELLPVHTFINDSYLLEQGPHQLLGLQHRSASSRPIRATPPTRATACASSRRWWRASTTPGSR